MPLADLRRTLVDFPWYYLVSVDGSRAHARPVPTEIVPDEPTADRDGQHGDETAGHPCRLRALVGQSTLSNLTRHPAVTLLFPHPDPAQMSLIIDGVGTPAGAPHVGGSPGGTSDWLIITPTSAVLHRSAVTAAPACS